MCLSRILLAVGCLIVAAPAPAEVLVRWDGADVPSRENLGVPALVMPAGSEKAIDRALALGFRVYAEVDAASLAAFIASDRLAGVVVNGPLAPEQLAAFRQRLGRAAPRVLSAARQGVWPHVRSNVVTTRNNVLQVASRTAQPWLEHNAAVIRAAAHGPDAEPSPLLSIVWKPSTAAEADEGPALENYLVAIAEAGSFGADLVLPLHERLRQDLLLGLPSARAWWREIRQYIEFYSWSPPSRYRRVANVGLVTAQPARGLELEIAKLLVRHNLPYELIAPERLGAGSVASLRLLIVPEAPRPDQLAPLAEFARQGGTLMIATSGEANVPWRSGAPIARTEGRASYTVGEGRVVELLERVADPNRFALEVRDLLGRSGRVVDVWNGITVLAAPYEAPDRDALLLTVVNYAHEPEAVQIRVPGAYAVVEYESPEEKGAALLPYTQRDGYTEFLLPALRVGGRVFLSR